MKILLILQCFPPFNVIGSVRAAQLASYLESNGHELRIVAGDDLPFPKALNAPPLQAGIFRARLVNIEAPIDFGRRMLGGNTGASSGGVSSAGRGGWLVKMVRAYRSLVGIPDSQIGWYPAARAAVASAITGWTPDIIISSALPFTAHLVAAGASRITGVPWIAEYRDLFAGNPYADTPRWRRWLDEKIEKRVMKRASAFVGLTPQISGELARMHGKLALTVMNGFDDRGETLHVPPRKKGRDLRILYTGIVYPGKRDPAPLFAAIKSMGERGRRIVVEFYGQDLRGVREAAAAAAIEDQVKIHAPVSYSDSLRLQAEADVLLLLLWDDPREHGTLTGKVFEYIGSGRPILAVGCHDGIASTLVRERGFGVTATDPAAIVEALGHWIAQIDSEDTVPPISPSARQGLSRTDQFAVYEKLIADVVKAQHRPVL